MSDDDREDEDAKEKLLRTAMCAACDYVLSMFPKGCARITIYLRVPEADSPGIILTNEVSAEEAASQIMVSLQHPTREIILQQGEDVTPKPN